MLHCAVRSQRATARILVRCKHYIPGLHHEYGSLQDDLSPPPGTKQTAWQATENQSVQAVTQKALIYDLIHQQTRTLEDTVPWFLANMPSSYFRQVPESIRKDHIKAIAAVKDANMDIYLNLQSRIGNREILTLIRPGTAPGTLLHMLEELPDDKPLSRLHVFSTADSSMSLNMFIYGHSASQLSQDDIKVLARPIFKLAEIIQAGKHSIPPQDYFQPEQLLAYMSICRGTYLKIGADDPLRFLQHRVLVENVAGSDGTEIQISQVGKKYWVDLAVGNEVPQAGLENLCKILYIHKFDVSRARVDTLDMGGNGNSVTLLRALVEPTIPLDLDKTLELVARELKRSKWLDSATHKLVFEDFPDLGIERAEVMTGLGAAVHASIAKISPVEYSTTHILENIKRYMEISSSISQLFLDRFRPEAPLSDEEFKLQRDALQAKIKSDVQDRVGYQILSKMLDMVSYTLKTNVYMPDRYALSMRLDPICMENDTEPRDLPFGILFIHGRRFNGFHVRFRDIARGGLRLVTPASAEQHALESARQYDECYGLAFAQQLKNKDIPEGGSKAVCLIDTHGLSQVGKDLVMRKSVKAMTDAILDLIVETDYTKKYLVDLYKRREVLYLGPDEQVLPKDIEWIVKRAGVRGYETPAAFMSSKPKAGINHKEFGVTSEGVNVFLDVALRQALSIDPKTTPFTIKMTGGPDGDVAGNELNILIREYGDNVKVVGIADHSGCAEDPEGLNHAELLRLFHEGLCISNFDASKLSGTGVLHTVDTPEGIKARNSMHNRLKADAFLPCGGRPNTIDLTNYKQFLLPDGRTPSSPLIVEGANLFVTAKARKALYETANIAIVKDSSANKGGVITSSYEICAAMLLSEEEFTTHKETIVKEVLGKLRELAKLEAVLLFREFDDYADLSLPEVSQIISDCINMTTDALTTALDDGYDREALLPLFRNHLPQTMSEIAFDRLDRLPSQYIKNAIASCLASKIVYKEGTKFMLSQSKTKLASIALKYLEKERRIGELVASIRDSNIDGSQRQEILDLLEQGGARTALKL